MTTLDLCSLYTTLTEEERIVWQTARDFVTRDFLPVVREHHRAGTFPLQLVPQLGALGFLGATMPERYGGSAANARVHGLIMQELERGDTGLRSFASVQSSLVMYPIFRFGSDAQKDRWLPKLAAGDSVGCFGLTEPDFGSNPAGLRTRAERVASGYRLNGTKMWITNGSQADLAIIWAKLDGVIGGFIVERGTPGFAARPIAGKLSLRASDTAELSLSDCDIPETNRLPLANGLKAPLSCLTEARYGIAWGAVGSALATFHCALDYAKERIQFGHPIARYQLIQQRLTEMASDITHAQLLAFRLAELKDAGRAHHAVVSLAKRNNVRMALQTARRARSILGASGIVDDYPIMRHLMNLESVYTYEGTHDIHTLIIGQHLTGLNAITP